MIEVYNDKNVKFFYYDSIDLVLKAGKSVEKTKKYNLILEIAIAYLENCFLVVIFSNSHLIICIYQIYLNKIVDVT